MTIANKPLSSLNVQGFDKKFENILQTKEWNKLQSDFNSCNRILIVGNGGNLAVADHASIDIARLTNKSAAAPGSGILASSLINDISHDDWVQKWVDISLRGQFPENLSKTMLIGISSAGNSKNICLALDYALSKGLKAGLICASSPKIEGNYNVVSLFLNEYHTGEVLTLLLFYQLIHGSGFICPSIDKATENPNERIDYSA
tara:strand:- start:1863 stop:2471 length:609 start_codon:yes stop_codon:yes gene_type:complete